ncbi:hypothetical protein GOODEAATRI_033159 [Goodea atripinnis]|uniref:Uncharacterized protein n=1 Tax=Goodea atripinnis TaxID=208336 RepID=A0ABV0N673_9TELE
MTQTKYKDINTASGETKVNFSALLQTPSTQKKKMYLKAKKVDFADMFPVPVTLPGGMDSFSLYNPKYLTIHSHILPWIVLDSVSWEKKWRWWRSINTSVFTWTTD